MVRCHRLQGRDVPIEEEVSTEGTPTVKLARVISHVTITAITGLVTVCEDPVSSGYITADQPGQIEMALGAKPSRWANDQVTIDLARIERDTLYLRVKHGGGCARHEYALVAWNGWLESNPVQLGAFLAHDRNGDSCEALLTADLRFNLTPARDAFKDIYGSGPSTFILRLTDPKLTSQPPVLLTYNF